LERHILLLSSIRFRKIIILSYKNMEISLSVALIRTGSLMGWASRLYLEAAMEDTILILYVMKTNFNSKSSKEDFCRTQCSMALVRNCSKMGIYTLESSRVEFSKATGC
jgi:hypothetical protein